MAMISTKIITSLSDVPREWIFEYYLNLKEKLTGQDIKMLSAFNSKDRVPSMFIYFDASSGVYKFKDFSSGHQGGAVDLVRYLYSLDTAQAITKIKADYENYIKDNGTREEVALKIQDKYKVVDYEIRHWTNLDEAYWSKYKIGSKLLEYYEVAPLEFFKMEKEEDGEIISHVFNSRYIYGYFRTDGSLYKIYMPKNTEKKFIKVQNYVQGTDQLNLDNQNLVITSSLKDLMCFVKLGYKHIEVIAPDSENSMLSEPTVNRLKSKFRKICVMFDNDTAGIASMQKYQDRYGFEPILLDMEKDLSDSIAVHRLIKVKEKLDDLIKDKF
jgi:hypothetical protein